MAYSNTVTKLLDKIERRLGTRMLNLPDHLKKEKWYDIIKDESLLTFSRFYPHKIRYRLNRDTCLLKNNQYIIDEDKFPGIEILGIRDICWETFGNSLNTSSTSYGYNDSFNSFYDVTDIAMVQMAANTASLTNNSIYIDFEQPNKITLKNCYNQNITASFHEFDVDMLIKHADNLNTISPTIMETFEQLVMSDIAGFLYNELKYFDGLDTAYGNIELRLQDLETIMTKREDVINTLRDSYVSAENENQPMILTI